LIGQGPGIFIRNNADALKKCAHAILLFKRFDAFFPRTAISNHPFASSEGKSLKRREIVRQTLKTGENDTAFRAAV